MENKGNVPLLTKQIVDLCEEPGSKRADSDSQQSSKEPAGLNAPIATVCEPNNYVAENEKSFTDLPIELIDKIFNNVATSDLLNCRLVDRRWCDSASRIMRSRDDITLIFKFTERKFVQKIHHQHREKLCDSMLMPGSKTLTDLVDCIIQDPERFPFTSYRFDGLSKLVDGNVNHFLAAFGKQIRSLEVYITNSGLYSDRDELLRKLVSEEAPNLKILKIVFQGPFNEHPMGPRRLAGSTNGLKLPHLEVLCLDSFTDSKIFEPILIASPNLKSISFRGIIRITDLQMLQKTNKLHCVKKGHFIGKDVIAHWLECGPLPLQSLYLHFFTYGNHNPSLGDAGIIDQLFQSIKDSLVSFTTEPFGSLTEYKMPKFEKLQRLCLRPDFSDQHWPAPSFFPPSLDWADTFPNVTELDIVFSRTWFDPVFRRSSNTLPTIETLRISGSYQQDIAGLIKRTPNVTTLWIKGDEIVWHGSTPYMDEMVNFADISAYLPELQNFGWEMITGTKDMSGIPHMYEFDAKVTGLPVDLCKKLAVELRDRNYLSADEAAKYRSMLWPRRPSILDLKGLKHFYVQFTFMTHLMEMFYDFDDDGSESDLPYGADGKFDPVCTSLITKVSQRFAFDLMPNLKVFAHTVLD